MFQHLKKFIYLGELLNNKIVPLSFSVNQDILKRLQKL